MIRCLITGASGFIGSELVRSLHEQTQCDLMLTGRRLDRLPHGPDITLTQIDTIHGNTDWSHALKNVGVAIHTAARVHVMRDTTADALAAFRSVNTEGTLRLAQQAADAGVRRFVFLSSIGVLGHGGNSIYTEQSPPAPHTPYATSKHEAEDGLREIASRTGMEVVIIRPPLVYGSGAPGNFGRLANLIRRGIPLPLGRVHNLRSLVSIGNLSDFIQTCLWHPAAANQIFLVSDGEDLSTPALVRRMAQAMGTTARLVSVPPSILAWSAKLVGKEPMLQQLIGNLQIDSRKAHDVLNWTPPYSVDESLRRTFHSPSHEAHL